MICKRLFVIPIAVLLFSGAGCIVTKSLYDVKTAEVDSLRSALAKLNQEKTKLIAENTNLLERETACKEREADLTGQIKEMDDSLKRLAETLKDPRNAEEKSQMPPAESEKAAEQTQACEMCAKNGTNGISGKPANNP